MDPKNYFLQPNSALQKQYEALKSFYVDNLSAKDITNKFKISVLYFKNLRYNFIQNLKAKQNPFFPIRKTGPKERFTSKDIINEIISLRKLNNSIQDIKVILLAKGKEISLDTIDKILKDEGFAPLPKRTRQERLSTQLPLKIIAPESVSLEEIKDENFATEQGAGPLIFLPLIEKLGIVEAIKKARFPKTSMLSDVSNVLSFVALKILGNERLSHDTRWNMDRALGFFAGLNVLPKQGTLSSYSYRVNRSSNRKLLIELSKIFVDKDREDGEFNLDFKSIPHWGDVSILEKNWAGTRSKSMKSILSLIVESPSSGYLSYTDAEIKHRNQNDAILDFVDFWREGRGTAPKMLIFDSKLTTYQNLSNLNESKEKIKFITLRRRGKELLDKAKKIPGSEWKSITIDGEKRKYRNLLVNDSYCGLRNYKGQVRQVIITNNGRQEPSFLITNDFNINIKDIIKKYARRWLVEKEISERIAFFHLNSPSSSIVVKVDFDLTISLLTCNLYKVLASRLPGFEHCTVPTIYRNFIENGATVEIKNKNIVVNLKKKNHLPILFELDWMKEKTHLSWLGVDIKFQPGTFS